MRRPFLLALVLGVAVLWDGGFAPAPRVAFAGLALAALAAALVRDRAARGMLGWPVVLVLLALGLVGVLSALWTVGFASDAVRWGLVTVGYGAVVVIAAGVRAEVVAGLVCALAFVSGVVGLAAMAARTGPFADHVHGAWRPGGTLEYPPALALLQVSALPGLLAGLRRRRLRVWSAAGLVVALLVLGFGGSRLELALGAIVVAAALAAGGGSKSVSIVDGIRPTPRRAAVIAAVLLLATATAAVATTGRDAGEANGGFWHGRLHTWRAAVETAADHPLAGGGADSFLAASARHQREGPVLFAHDLPLELAAELGAIGALLALALYATAVAAVWRARRTRAGPLLGPAVLAFLAASLVDWPWHLAGSGAVWAAALGGIAGASARRTSFPAPNP
ncbi:MAG: O-antigen ligase family protein [Thermoleophilaceae bacterium]